MASWFSRCCMSDPNPIRVSCGAFSFFLLCISYKFAVYSSTTSKKFLFLQYIPVSQHNSYTVSYSQITSYIFPSVKSNPVNNAWTFIFSPPFAELIEFQRVRSVRIAGKDQRIIEPAPPTSEARIYTQPTRATVRPKQTAGSAKAVSAGYVNTFVGDHAVYLIVSQWIKIHNHQNIHRS